MVAIIYSSGYPPLVYSFAKYFFKNRRCTLLPALVPHFCLYISIDGGNNILLSCILDVLCPC